MEKDVWDQKGWISTGRISSILDTSSVQEMLEEERHLLKVECGQRRKRVEHRLQEALRASFGVGTVVGEFQRQTSSFSLFWPVSSKALPIGIGLERSGNCQVIVEILADAGPHISHLYDARVWKASWECLIMFLESLAHGQYEVMCSLLLFPGHGTR